MNTPKRTGSFEIQLPIRKVLLAKDDGTVLYEIELQTIPKPGEVISITVPGKVEFDVM